MIKRSFIGLTEPKLMSDLLESGPTEPEAVPIPPRMILLLNEPLDSTKESRIKKGDMVKKGARLFLYNESTDCIISPASGTITTLSPVMNNSGHACTSLTLETTPGTDENTDFAEYADAPDIESAAKFLSGLPGNPPISQLAAPNSKIEKIIINAVDGDLLTTTQQFVLSRYRDEISQGIDLLKRLTGVTDISLALPANMANLAAFGGVNLIKITPNYTDSLPEIILQKHLGIAFVPGKSCAETGVAFISAEALFSLVHAYAAKAPVFEKFVGVIDKNGKMTRVSASIGTPIQEIVTQLGIDVEEKDRVILGGPLKGVSVYTLDYPVQADTDNIMIQASDEIPAISDYPCINCGNCVRICPANVPVNLLVRYLEVNQYQEAADGFDLLSCIECGLCSYVCRASIPIFQYIRLGKQELMKLEAELEMEDDDA